MPADDLATLSDRVVGDARWPLGRPPARGPRVSGSINEYEDGLRHPVTVVLWRWSGRWRLDLTDAATGGVLYGLLRSTDPDAGWEVHDESPNGLSVLSWPYPGVPERRTYTAATLGEAALRALAASWGVE
jgi:hypothetical protein